MSAHPMLVSDSSLQEAARASPNLGHDRSPWGTPTPTPTPYAVQTTSSQLNGPQPYGRPAHQQTHYSQPPSSAGPSSASSSMQPPSRGNSQGPAPGMAHMPPTNTRTSAGAPNGISAFSPQPSGRAHVSGTAHPVPAAQANAFPSPKASHANLQHSSEYRELKDAIMRTRPEVVRQVVRDLGDKCLLGSEYHLSFIANAAFHQAGEGTLNRAIQDYGQRMIRSSKKLVVEHFRSQDLDEMADQIYAKASNEFLDQGMARRLETISAQPLINALARAERLGYDIRDIVEETPNGAEHVVPSFQPMSSLARASQPVPSQNDTAAPALMPQRQASVIQGTARSSGSPAPAGPPSSHGIVHCSTCGRPCSGPNALQYHLSRKACEHTHRFDKIGKDICPHCGSLFISSGGLTYHVKSKVCGDYSAATEEAVLAELHAKSFGPVNSGSRASVPLTAGCPTPTQTRPNARQILAEAAGRTPVFTPPRSGPNTPQDDPYAKLTPQQRLDFEADMQKAEEKYGALMQEAMKLSPAKREEELAKLKNSYNTKQSVTRKKYGIRLRVRRTQAEIEAERSRLLGASGSGSGPDSAGHRPQKRARISAEGRAFSPQQTSHPDGGREDSTPRKRQAPTAISDGPAGAPAAAEQTDHSTLPTPSEPRSIEQVTQLQTAAQRGTCDDPMQIDDSSGSDDSGSGSDDEDIPAQLPAHKS